MQELGGIETEVQFPCTLLDICNNTALAIPSAGKLRFATGYTRMAERFVVMGDVTGSSKLPGDVVMRAFRELIVRCQDDLADRILSPLTITLGDEFQGIVADRRGLFEVIFNIEDARLAAGLPFDLHYAGEVGAIDTPLNRKSAHGMLGPALTAARKRLTDKSPNRKKYAVSLGRSRLQPVLDGLLAALEGLESRWRQKDFELVADLLAERPVKMIAAAHSRDTTSVYRRRQSLRITDYLGLRAAVLALAGYIDLVDMQ